MLPVDQQPRRPEMPRARARTHAKADDSCAVLEFRRARIDVPRTVRQSTACNDPVQRQPPRRPPDRILRRAENQPCRHFDGPFERFRRDPRAGVAIQLVFLRASGHTLDHVGALPRQLLRYVGERLGLPTPTIASLRTLYQRYKTLYEHQVWTCEYLGMTSIGPSHWAELKAWMRQDATESPSLDELLQHAHCWLYERRVLIPAERKLRALVSVSRTLAA
ncbi:DUF4158 domain-containing protein [Paraburkholderia sabiae]|uniref:DUF4158 domain-containing protein n=1 Tax=Paraburkholderia sabiae TaxID=273251 RepID=A0ABU9QS61_9BURK|nr:DUF4158 domain-containing protein [Paraburkholderia sabiae]WJZ79377.1 DUF4158 domain-containing protein [Paraburkholderia sabiae]